MNNIFIENLKKFRLAKGLTQEQVAEQIGVSRQKYARIENGANSITFDILAKIAKVLKVSVGDITRVLDEQPAVEYRGGEGGSSNQIFEMLDLFYANKHMYDRLKSDSDL